MLAFHIASALFAILMLVRHGPATIAALRGTAEGERRRGSAAVSVLIVALSLLVLVSAMKGLFTGLISR